MLKSKEVFIHAHYSVTSEFDALLSKYGKQFGVITKHDYSAFYATLLAEVGTSASIKTENLNYSTKALKKTFKVYRDNPNLAYWHGRSSTQRADQMAIGNHAYANRMGNGDVASGDGWKYRGRGFIQLTGKSNYKKASEVILECTGINLDLVKNPDNAGTVKGAVLTALAFWKINELGGKSIDQITDKVNKYTDSRAKRKKYYSDFMKIG